MNIKLKQIQHFLGLNKNIASMLLMVILIGLGEKMGERFLPIYLLAIGGSTYAVGALNALDNFLSAFYAYLGGRISDRLGYKKALKIYCGIAMFGYLIVILFPSWIAVFIGSLFFISWSSLSLPAILSLVSSSLQKEKHIMGVSLHSLFRRLPMALGPILGAILIDRYGVILGTRLAFISALIFSMVSMIFIQIFITDRKERAPAISIKYIIATMSHPLKVLLLSDILIRFAEQIPYAFVVIYVIKNLNQSALFFSTLTLIEMMTALLIYIPVAALSEKIASKWLVSLTFVFFTMFPIVLFFSTSKPLLMMAFLLRGLKEFGEPTRKALIVKLANEDAKASTFGTYYLIRDVVVSIAAMFSAFLWNISPATNFLVASGFGFCGLMIFILYGKDENS